MYNSLKKQGCRKHTILLDVDDTINNLISQWISIYNERYNDDLKHEDITDWDMTKFVKPECGENIYKLLGTPNLFSDLVSPLLNSIEVTKTLSEYFDIYIVSRCYDTNIIEQKLKFLEKHFPHLNKYNFISTRHKFLIKGDIMIDDSIENITTSICDYKLLFTQPHNKHFITNNEDIIRVNNWNEILQWFIFKFKI